ncbi:hypothetical protein Aph01nite_18160 [Acrocarpospora phusangensis]|uniref:Uncharacterized protein n=1 Tax=Acrocarpospora phusangensis TaxID=1070424 RepID=A0A919UJ72_9ACTN|nr:hypothetical protein [Acrocarpospora phusangensis]GIH23506.1 hypothetical protein Aph01nite_18160 [Acrocarpospora phusangensis]
MDDQPERGLVPLSVEILALRVDEAGRWRYRRLVTALRDGETPDEAVRRHVGVAADDQATVVHSTSWRYQPKGRLVLTYAVCPDPDPLASAEELTEFRLARGSTPAAPSPDDVQVENVAAHALRHLAHLLHSDDVVATALNGTPSIVHGLRRLPADLMVSALR